MSSYPLTTCCVHHYSITRHWHIVTGDMSPPPSCESQQWASGWNVKCKVNHWDNGPFIGRVVGHLICMMGFLILNEEASARDAMGLARSCHDHWSDIVSWEEEVRGSGLEEEDRMLGLHTLKSSSATKNILHLHSLTVSSYENGTKILSERRTRTQRRQ